MPAIVLLGAQWGDEGKGKATDLLGRNEKNANYNLDYINHYIGAALILRCLNYCPSYPF